MAIATLYPTLTTKAGERGAKEVVISKNDMFDDVSDKISAQDMLMLRTWERAGPNGRNLVISAQSAYRPSILLASTSVLDKSGRRAVHHCIAKAAGKRMGSRTDPSGGIVAYWKFAEKPDTRNKGE